MASKTSVCGICNRRHIVRPSDIWCSECDEGLCLECKEHHDLSKATCNHNIVPISKYESLPTIVLEISQFCSAHKEKFQIYCKKHECPCCGSCVISDHQNCHDLIQLEVMIQNVKESCGFQDIEQTMNAMIENIQRIKKDRLANLSTLRQSLKMIEKEIEQTRIKIIANIDNMHRAIIKELYETEYKESTMIGHLLNSIEKIEKDVTTYHENLINIKEHASDLQTFLAMKQMNRDVAEKDNNLTSLVKSNKLNRVNLSYKMSDSLQITFNERGKLGEIIVSTHSSDVALVRKTETQAQNVVAHVRSMSIENLSCVLKSTVDTQIENIRGCTLLPEAIMVFSCNKRSFVRGFKRDGSQEFHIKLTTCAFDITYIHDQTAIAVTSGEGEKKCISLIDAKSRTVKEVIPLQSESYGIVSRNDTLVYWYLDFVDRGLAIMNLTDGSVRQIARRDSSLFKYATTPWKRLYGYVASFGDKLYYTNRSAHTVTCCDLQGTTQWEFKKERVLNNPHGISVDNAGNVYVIGYVSCNVVVISPDGQRHRRLLSGEDGISNPTGIYYDIKSNHLLVANKRGKAFLFKLE